MGCQVTQPVQERYAGSSDSCTCGCWLSEHTRLQQQQVGLHRQEVTHLEEGWAAMSQK